MHGGDNSPCSWSRGQAVLYLGISSWCRALRQLNLNGWGRVVPNAVKKRRNTPDALDVGSRNQEFTLRRLVKEQVEPHADGMVSSSILSERLRHELIKRSEESASVWRSVTPAALDEIINTCASILIELKQSELMGPHIVDPVSGYQLPPPEPEILYKDRKAVRELRTLTPEEFISRTGWAKFRDAGLLAAEFIKYRDFSLYSALSSRARYMGRMPSELMKDCGLLTREDIDHPGPDPDLQHRVRLIRAVRALGILTGSGMDHSNRD